MLVGGSRDILCGMLGRLAVIVAVWVPGLAAAAVYELAPDSDVIGESRVIEAKYEDTFVALARTYNLGFEELRHANPDVDPWLPGEGTEIVLPLQHVLPDVERVGVVLNLPELRLYYFPNDGSNTVVTHPISIGRMEWKTPLGSTTVVRKSVDPTWYPPESIRKEHAEMGDPLPAVVPPGPDNPLGNHALYLGISGYLIHGTNKPAGLGMRVTHGCIRMFPEDIEALFDVIEPGTSVTIVNQPYKLGWGEGGLYLEAHRPLGEERESDEWSATELTRIFVAVTEERYAQVSWGLAERIMGDGRGIPHFVSIPGAQRETAPDGAEGAPAEGAPAEAEEPGEPGSEADEAPLQSRVAD